MLGTGWYDILRRAMKKEMKTGVWEGERKGEREGETERERQRGRDYIHCYEEDLVFFYKYKLE